MKPVLLVADILEILLRRQEAVMSDDVKDLLKRAGVELTDQQLAKALMVLELNRRIYVRRTRRGGKEVFQIYRR